MGKHALHDSRFGYQDRVRCDRKTFPPLPPSQLDGNTCKDELFSLARLIADRGAFWMRLTDFSPSIQLILVGLLAVALALPLIDPRIGIHLSRKSWRPHHLSEELECGAMPGFGMVSAAGWPRTNPALGIFPFHRSLAI